MRTITRRLAAAATLAVVALTGASAGASAYTPSPLTITANPTPPGGATFFAPNQPFSLTVVSLVPCLWTGSFVGQTQTQGASTTFSPTFRTPAENGLYTGTISCNDDISLASTGDSDAQLAAIETTTFAVQVGPPAGSSAGGVLPATGSGVSGAVLLGAAAAVGVGGALVVQARRRA